MRITKYIAVMSGLAIVYPLNSSCSRQGESLPVTPTDEPKPAAGVGTNSSSSSDPLSGTYTWVSGSNTADQAGSYGEKGVASSSNVPGARWGSVSWTDRDGNLWLFGGVNYGVTPEHGRRNDLWKFDGSHWTWVSGSNAADQAGSYGEKGVPSGNNVPGARGFGTSWTDRSGNLWLFGGQGIESDQNDLWKFDGINWTWISGSNNGNQGGLYGIKGVASSDNMPGGREGSVSWTDLSGNLWLFGGLGYGEPTHYGYRNDLWKFDGINWTWVAGNDALDQAGSYGTKGVPSSSNVPGARAFASSWTDLSGNLWLFGGCWLDGNDLRYLNDLWKFDGINWTWVSGSATADHAGSYGTRGVSSNSNVPGARCFGTSWADLSGNLWLFGGEVPLSNRVGLGYLNDLWKFDGNNWTWVSGSSAADQAGSYGERGVVSGSNVPGARMGGVSWTDGAGNLWLFGGVYNWTSYRYLNDLWKFELN